MKPADLGVPEHWPPATPIARSISRRAAWPFDEQVVARRAANAARLRRAQRDALFMLFAAGAVSLLIWGLFLALGYWLLLPLLGGIVP